MKSRKNSKISEIRLASYDLGVLKDDVAGDHRKARLAEALRKNLRRRKDQDRHRRSKDLLINCNENE